MIEDMKLAGLSPATQATYIDAMRKLAAHYRRSPDQLGEEEVRAYILPPPRPSQLVLVAVRPRGQRFSS